MKDVAKSAGKSMESRADLNERAAGFASAELRKTRDYLENILENSPDAIGIVDRHGRFLKWNHMAAELYGYSFQELKGKKAFDLYADREELNTMLSKLRKEGVVKRYEINMKRKDGSIVPFEISISLLKDNKQKIIGSVCVARDLSDIKKTLSALKGINVQLNQEIAERQRTEAELKTTRDYLENVLENSPDGIGIVDRQGRLVKWNRMAAELYGYSFQELRGKKIFDLYANPLELDKMLRQLRRDEVVKRYEIDMKRKDGSIVPFEISISLLKDNEGTIIGSVCVARDLSDIKRALTALKESNDQLSREILERQRIEEELQAYREHLEDLVAARTVELRRANKQLRQEIAERLQVEKALRKAEEKYRDIFENAVEGIFQTSLDGRFITANPAMARMLGYDSPEDLVKTVTAIDRQVYADPQRLLALARRLEDQGMVRFFEAQLYRKDLSKIWVSISGRAVFDLEGAMQYFEGTAMDITEHKRAEIDLHKRDQQLLQAQELAHLGSWTYVPATQTSEWSAEMFRIFGRDPEKGVPSFPEEHLQLIHPDDWDTLQAALQAAMEAGKGFDLEVRILRPDGELRHIITKAQVLLKPDGTVDNLFGTVLDITDSRHFQTPEPGLKS